MALDAGQIFFGIEAVEVGFDKAIQKTKDLRKANNLLSRAQVTQQKKTLSGSLALEKAQANSIIKAKDFATQLKLSGAPEAALNKVTQALNTFVNRTSKANLTTRAFSRSQIKLKGDLAEVTRQTKIFNAEQRNLTVRAKSVAKSSFNSSSGFSSFNKGAFRASKRAGKFSETLKDLQSASVLAVGPLSGVGARISAIGAIAGRSTLKTVLFFASFTAGIVALGALVSGAIKTRIELQKIDKILLTVSGSASQASKDFNFIASTSDRLGLKVIDTAEAFSKFSAATKGSVLQGKATKTIFTELSAAAGTLGFTTEKTGQLFRAFEQIVSKGTVQSEELKGQIGEVLPGAFQTFAKSLGKTTQQLTKLLKAGEIRPKALLAFAKTITQKLGVDSSKAIDTLSASLNRLDNSQVFFNKRLDEITGASKGFKAIIDGLSNSIRGLTDNLNGILTVSGALLGGVIALGARFLILKGIMKLTSIAVAKTLAQQKLVGASFNLSAIKGLSLAKILSKLRLAFTGLGGPITFAIGLLGSLALSFIDFGDSQRQSAEDTEVFSKRLRDLNEAFIENGNIVSKSIAKTNLAEGAREIQKQVKIVQNANDEIKTLQERINKLSIGSSIEGFFVGLGLEGNIIEKLKNEVKTKKENIQTALDKQKDLSLNLKILQNKPFDVLNLEQLTKKGANDVQRKAEKQIETLQKRLEAIRGGPKALQLFTVGEKSKKEIENFKKTLQVKIKGKNVLSDDEINNLVERFKRVNSLIQPSLDGLELQKQKLADFGKIGDEAFKKIEDGILDVIDGTQSLGKVFSSVVNGMIRSLTKFFLEAAIGGKASGGSIFTNLFSKVFPAFLGDGPTQQFGANGVALPTRPPTRAAGGPIGKGQTFIGAERGPELFTATSSGFISPNNSLSGGSQVNISIINNASNSVATAKETTSGGNRSIEVIIDDIVAGQINSAQSRTNKSLKGFSNQRLVGR